VQDDLRSSISAAYGAISKANNFSSAYCNGGILDASNRIPTQAMDSVRSAIPLIEAARERLLRYVSSEPPD
jgi:hypothetical protein